MRRSFKRYKPKTVIFLCFYMTLALLLLLVVGSYTWFALSAKPRVSDMQMYVNSVTGLELSDDINAEEWVLQLDFRDLADETAPLRPITWSEEQQQFLTAGYHIDGGLLGLDQWKVLTDERNANKNDRDGYYSKATFYARTDQQVTVSLSPAVEVDEGIKGSGTYVIGTPLWDGERIVHNNGGQGAECALRIGIRVTPVDAQGKKTGAAYPFYIYEPNSDAHPYGEAGYFPTPSIDGTETLVPNSRLILQTASSWTEAYPVRKDVVIKQLGKFTTDAELFTLKPGQIVRIELYIWLEGNDPDCTNEIESAQILANIQFATETEGQSGLKPVK